MANFDVKALREKVLTSDDIKYDEVYVKDWDVTLPVKTLSSADMKAVTEAKDNIRMAIVAVLRGCKTQEGEAVFEAKDLAKFENDKSFAPIKQVAEKILEMSGMNEDEADEVKNS